MVKRIFMFAFLATAFLVVSCNSDDNATVNPYAQFQGNWSGTFSGDDGVFPENYAGTWTATIDENGVATGALESNIATFPFSMEGQVSASGEVTATYYDIGGQAVGTMTGIMTETTASGVWDSTSLEMQGTWEGSKE